MRIVRLGWYLFATTVLVLLPARAASAQVAVMSLEDLSQSSTAIVLGKTQQMRSFWNDQRSQILTEITVQVDEALKGGEGTEAVITVPGGRVGNTLYEVSDMPVFVEGEEVLVFLWEHPSGRMLVNGGMQGKLEIVADDVTGRKTLRGAPRQRLEADNLAKADGERIGPEAPSSRPSLDGVVAQIKAYVADN